MLTKRRAYGWERRYLSDCLCLCQNSCCTPLFCGQLRLRSDHTCQYAQFCARMTGSGTHGCQNRVLRPVSTSANSAATDYQSMRSSKSKLKASVYWRTRGQFWKLNQVQLFCDQSERKPISLRLFNARTCDCTGWRDRIRWSENPPLKHIFVKRDLPFSFSLKSEMTFFVAVSNRDQRDLPFLRSNQQEFYRLVRTQSFNFSFYGNFVLKFIAIRTEQTRLVRCLLYGFFYYSSGKRVKSLEVLTGDQELAVRKATYGLDIDQSQIASLPTFWPRLKIFIYGHWGLLWKSRGLYKNI